MRYTKKQAKQFIADKFIKNWIKDNREFLDDYRELMEKETDSKTYKPFYTIYAKHRCWFNPLRYVLGEFKFKWFEKNKQPQKYKNVFDIFN